MKRIFAIFAVLIAAFGMTGCGDVISTGNVGVVKYAGQYDQKELDPGWYFKPLSSIYEVSTKENALQFNDVKAKTANQITLEDLDLDVYYQLSPDKATETMSKLAGDLAQNKDGDFVPGQSYINRVAREAIYNAVSEVTSDQAQAKRTEIPEMVRAKLQKELDDKWGKGWWSVTSVNLRALTVDSTLEKKIREAAQVQYEIDAKKKQVELARQEAERQRAQAQGEADATRIKAEALRTAQGAEYLKLLELQNQEKAIAKWDGNLPNTVLGGAMPMISVGK